MGKRIISQRRGRGTRTYRVRRKAFVYRLQYPRNLFGEAIVERLLDSAGHSAPIARIRHNKEFFYIPAFKGMFEGQKINYGEKKIENGNILALRDIPVKTSVYCIESRPGDGGKFIKTGGNNAVITKVVGEKIFVIMPSKKEKGLHPSCRAIIGEIAGAGRLDKPFVKAGKKHHLKKAKNKLWPRTSAIKMNVVDHPFGSGRGKHPKSKIAKRNAPPGRRVGLIRPRRTGRKK
jgi:large subunit ribosomal protein L2